jgi:hypothetical protein
LWFECVRVRVQTGDEPIERPEDVGRHLLACPWISESIDFVRLAGRDPMCRYAFVLIFNCAWAA